MKEAGLKGPWTKFFTKMISPKIIEVTDLKVAMWYSLDWS